MPTIVVWMRPNFPSYVDFKKKRYIILTISELNRQVYESWSIYPPLTMCMFGLKIINLSLHTKFVRTTQDFLLQNWVSGQIFICKHTFESVLHTNNSWHKYKSWFWIWNKLSQTKINHWFQWKLLHTNFISR